MRVLVLCAIAACGGHRASVPSNTSSTTAKTAAAADDGPEDCASTVEDAAPGNHDRFAFETNDGLYGYRDGKGKVVIAPRFRFAYEFKPGGIAAAVDSDATFVFIDASGKVIARAYAFDNGPDYFQEGHARIVGADKKVGFINDRGEITIAPRFDAADSFCGGKAQVRDGERQLFVDKRGEPTSPPAATPDAR